MFTFRNLFVVSYAGGMSVYSYQEPNHSIQTLLEDKAFFYSANTFFKNGDFIFISCSDGGAYRYICSTPAGMELQTLS